MRIFKVTGINFTAVFLLIFTGILGGGAPRVLAQSHNGMHDKGMTSPPSCQSVCSNMSGIVPAATKRDEEEQDKDQNSAEPNWPQLNPFEFSFIRKLKSTLESVRQLRPPDIIALNCIYRF